MNQFGSDKIFKHLDRVIEWQNSGVSRPITYELDMTNVCNSKCPFCFGFYGGSLDSSSLSLKDAKEIIGQIQDFGGKAITFTGGGDPLCNKATPQSVIFAKRKGMDVGFITNGILLNDEIGLILLKNCTWIRISLDAGTAETYKLTHGLNDNIFSNLKDQIAGLVQLKRRLSSRTTIGVGFLTFPDSLDDMENFVKLSLKLGVDYAQFRPLLRKTGDMEINSTPGNKVARNMRKCITYSNDNFKVLCSIHKYGRMENNDTKRLYNQCYGHNFAAVIAANKKMYLCCHMRGIQKYCIGDLNIHSLGEIWQSDRRKNIYQAIDFNDCPLLCRCDGINSALWNICSKSEHVNFL